jgi:hypothetical protein
MWTGLSCSFVAIPNVRRKKKSSPSMARCGGAGVMDRRGGTEPLPKFNTLRCRATYLDVLLLAEAMLLA